MNGIRARSTILAVLAVLLATSLGSSFPHGHAAGSGGDDPADPAPTHEPRPSSCVETPRGSDPDAPCALCAFQRVVSQSQFRAEFHADPLVPQSSLAVRADHADLGDRACSSDPRGPPLV